MLMDVAVQMSDVTSCAASRRRDEGRRTGPQHIACLLPNKHNRSVRCGHVVQRAVILTGHRQSTTHAKLLSGPNNVCKRAGLFTCAPPRFNTKASVIQHQHQSHFEDSFQQAGRLAVDGWMGRWTDGWVDGWSDPMQNQQRRDGKHRWWKCITNRIRTTRLSPSLHWDC